MKKRKLYNFDGSFQVPESTARWQNNNSQPRGSDVPDVPDVPDEPVNGIPCRLKGYPVIDVQSNFEHSGDCDVSDELVNDLEGPDVDCDVIAHGSGTRVSSHATTGVDSDEDSEDDSDVEMLVGMWAEMWIVLCKKMMAKYLASNVGLNKLATSFKNECFKSDTGRYMARTSQAQNGNDTSTCS
eukprot:Em0006g85a